MTRKKQNAKDREAMRRTQPKMIRVIQGLKGGRGRMRIEEDSLDVQDARKKTVAN